MKSKLLGFSPDIEAVLKNHGLYVKRTEVPVRKDGVLYGLFFSTRSGVELMLPLRPEIHFVVLMDEYAAGCEAGCLDIIRRTDRREELLGKCAFKNMSDTERVLACVEFQDAISAAAEILTRHTALDAGYRELLEDGGWHMVIDPIRVDHCCLFDSVTGVSLAGDLALPCAGFLMCLWNYAYICALDTCTLPENSIMKTFSERLEVIADRLWQEWARRLNT